MSVRKMLLGFGAAAAVVAVAIAASAFIVGGEGDSSNGAKSGLRGIVLIYGCASADNDSCVSEPVTATQTVRRQSDEALVTEFRSRSDGSFRLALEPGRYIIEGLSGRELGTASLSPLYVAVPKKGFRYIKVVYVTSRA